MHICEFKQAYLKIFRQKLSELGKTRLDNLKRNAFNALFDKGLRVKDAADVLGVSPQYISNLRSGRTIPDHIFDTILDKYPEIEATIYPKMKGGESEHTIPFVSVKARAGYQTKKNDPKFITDLPRNVIQAHDISHPDSPQRAFEIEGNSMEPTLKHGDEVFCRLINPYEGVMNGRVHVIVPKLESGLDIVIKRVDKKRDMLICTSDNKEDVEAYSTYRIDLDEVAELWYVWGRFTRNLKGPDELYDRVLELESKFMLLQEDLQQYFEDKSI